VLGAVVHDDDDDTWVGVYRTLADNLKDVVSVADFSASFWNRGEEGPCTPVRQGGTWHRGGGPPSAGPRVLLPDPPALRAALGCLAGRCCPSRWTGER
jgi:hypothetical protein